MTSSAHRRASKMGMCTDQSSRSMTRTRSNSWRASKASRRRLLIPPCVRPWWSVYADDPPTRPNDNVLTSTHVCTVIPSLLYYHTRSHPHFLYLLFLLVTPLTFFPGSRRLQESGQLVSSLVY